MSTITRSGYEKDNIGSWIAKDPSSQLTYSMDWSQWLPEGDTLASASYSLQVRANDPAPLVKVSQGTQSGTISYVELSGGQVGKLYTVTATITTVDGLTDRRSFRLKVENRSA
jgi:hypothetical protein